MNVIVWIVSGLLAAFFLFAGFTKLSTPRAKLLENPQMGWAGDFSDGMVKLIGALEVLAAIGLILPWALDIAPVLTPLAAVGLVALMIGAAVTHLRRGEAKVVPMNAILLVLAAFVAIVRFSQ